MELRHLRYFVTVVEELHFGRAAQKLNIVQPALSKQIIDLEEQIGTPLLLRTSRRVALTQAGQLFYQEALVVLKQAERAVDMAQRAGRGQSGVIRVGYAGNAAFAGILSSCLRRYRLEVPDVELQLIEMSANAQREALTNNRLDIAFAPNFQSELAVGLATEVMHQSPWVIGMVEDHPLHVFDALQGQQLRGQSFIVYGDNLDERGQVDVLRRLLNDEPKIVGQVTSTIATLTLAAAGYGLALLPASLCSLALTGLIYRPLSDFHEQLAMNIFYRANEQQPVIKRFLELALESVAE